MYAYELNEALAGLGAAKKKKDAKVTSTVLKIQKAPSAWPVWAPYAAAVVGIMIGAYILLKRN